MPEDPSGLLWKERRGSCRVLRSAVRVARCSRVKKCCAPIRAAGLLFAAAFNRHCRCVAGGPNDLRPSAERIGNQSFDLGPRLLKRDAHGGRRVVVVDRQLSLGEALELQRPDDVGRVPITGSRITTPKGQNAPRLKSLANANRGWRPKSTIKVVFSAIESAILQPKSLGLGD